LRNGSSIVIFAPKTSQTTPKNGPFLHELYGNSFFLFSFFKAENQQSSNCEILLETRTHGKKKLINKKY
jgi:hypothetical protein